MAEYSRDRPPLKTCDHSLVSPNRVIPPSLTVEQGRKIQRCVGTEVPHRSRLLPDLDRTLDVPVAVRHDSFVEQLGPCRLTLRLDVELIRRIDPLRLGKHRVRFAVLPEPCMR